jgi:hypothetical protein
MCSIPIFLNVHAENKEQHIIKSYKLVDNLGVTIPSILQLHY